MGPWARHFSPDASSPRPRPRFGAASTWSPRGRRDSALTSNAYCSAASGCALEGRLPAVVQGKDRPAAADCLDLAELCLVQKHYATAARLYAEALAATPRLTEDLRAGHRFNAARAAALAGGGHGDDATGLGEPERAQLRKQARDWLRLDLAAWAKKVDTGTAADRIQAQKTLAPWRDDPDLAGLRDADALQQLPSAERQDCQALWQRGCSPARPCPDDPVSIRPACSTRSMTSSRVPTTRASIRVSLPAGRLEAGDFPPDAVSYPLSVIQRGRRAIDEIAPASRRRPSPLTKNVRGLYARGR